MNSGERKRFRAESARGSFAWATCEEAPVLASPRREDAARKWPRWVQQAKEFYATPLGKVAAVVLLAALLATGVLR